MLLKPLPCLKACVYTGKIQVTMGYPIVDHLRALYNCVYIDFIVHVHTVCLEHFHFSTKNVHVCSTQLSQPFSESHIGPLTSKKDEHAHIPAFFESFGLMHLTYDGCLHIKIDIRLFKLALNCVPA